VLRLDPEPAQAARPGKICCAFLSPPQGKHLVVAQPQACPQAYRRGKNDRGRAGCFAAGFQMIGNKFSDLGENFHESKQTTFLER